MEIEPSARKHGVEDANYVHAVRLAVFVHYFEGYLMVVGPGRDGRLLEVGINAAGQILHAMGARPKYYRKR